MLTQAEQKALTRIERQLRAEDARFTRAFEAFRPDFGLGHPAGRQLAHPLAAPPTMRESVVRAVRWACGAFMLVLVAVLWVTAVVSSGGVASVTRIMVIPMTSVLLAACLAVCPRQPRRRLLR